MEEVARCAIRGSPRCASPAAHLPNVWEALAGIGDLNDKIHEGLWHRKCEPCVSAHPSMREDHGALSCQQPCVPHSFTGGLELEHDSGSAQHRADQGLAGVLARGVVISL